MKRKKAKNNKKSAEEEDWTIESSMIPCKKYRENESNSLFSLIEMIQA
jgi:hypothetical protein